MKSLLVSIGMLALLTVTPAHGETVTAKPLSSQPQTCPPLGIRDVWLFRATAVLPGGSSEVHNVRVVVSKRNGNEATLDLIGDNGSLIQWLMESIGGKVYHRMVRFEGFTGFALTDIPACPHPKPGQRLLFMNDFGIEMAMTTTAVTPTFVEIDVPAGRFLTRKVEYDVVIRGPNPSSHQVIHYYADGIGSVKEIFLFPDGSRQIHELLETRF